MKLLLDTHVLLWAAADSDRLSGATRTVLLDAANELWFSVASIWEISIKTALGRVDFQVDAMAFRSGLVANGYRELAIGGPHCGPMTNLPNLHSDPFDRMLVSQALVEGLTLMTADAKVAAYPCSILRI